MFKFIKRIMGLSGEYRKKLDRAYVLSFFESLASNVPICMLLYVLMTIMDGNFGKNSIIIAFTGIFAGVILRMICRYLTDINQSGVGYEIFARERMNFGDRIKRFPMGFFSEDNIGNVTSVITNDISFVEEHGMDTLGKITTSVIGIGISFVFLYYNLDPIFSAVIRVCPNRIATLHNTVLDVCIIPKINIIQND